MPAAQTKVLNVTITRPFEDVYAFLADLQNFPAWASGLGTMRRQVGANEWLANSLVGEPVKIKLAPLNDYGIVDHYVTPDNGDVIYVPMRVVRNGEGSEVIFTLFRLEDISDTQFSADEKHVRKDLDALKKLLES